jgi:predicted RNase H-like HicB family nuclease
MRREVFMAAFRTEDGGAFSVMSPDVPAAISQGDDLDTALLKAIVLEETLQPPSLLPVHRRSPCRFASLLLDPSDTRRVRR